MKYYWPKTTFDKCRDREWIHPEIPQYFLYQRPEDQFWVVIDRTMDLSVGKAFKRKSDTIRWFLKHWNPKPGSARRLTRQN